MSNLFPLLGMLFTNLILLKPELYIFITYDRLN